MGEPAPALEPATRVRRPDWVAHVRDGDVTILLHLPSARRVGLGPEGTAVWQQILAGGSGGASGEAIASAVSPAYDADPVVIEGDVCRLLAELLAGDLVEVVPRDGAPPGAV